LSFSDAPPVKSFALSSGDLIEVEAMVFDYCLKVPDQTDQVSITIALEDDFAGRMTVNNREIDAGAESEPITLSFGIENVIRINVKENNYHTHFYTISIRRNSLKRMVVESYSGSDISHTQVYEYNAKRQVTVYHYYYPDGLTYCFQYYQYNAANQLIWQTNIQDGSLIWYYVYTYRADGSQDTLKCYYGEVADAALRDTLYYTLNHVYNDAGQRTEKIYQYINGDIGRYIYTYNEQGLLVKTDYYGNGALNYSATYNYDDQDRYKSIEYTGHPNVIRQVYQYNEDGLCESYTTEYSDNTPTVRNFYSYEFYSF
jgi:hypothetical protein